MCDELWYMYHRHFPPLQAVAKIVKPLTFLCVTSLHTRWLWLVFKHKFFREWKPRWFVMLGLPPVWNKSVSCFKKWFFVRVSVHHLLHNKILNQFFWSANSLLLKHCFGAIILILGFTLATASVLEACLASVFVDRHKCCFLTLIVDWKAFFILVVWFHYYSLTVLTQLRTLQLQFVLWLQLLCKTGRQF